MKYATARPYADPSKSRAGSSADSIDWNSVTSIRHILYKQEGEGHYHGALIFSEVAVEHLACDLGSSHFF